MTLARPLPFRAHTILGACEALGEDFGISPMWFRVPLAVSVLISPTYAILGYLALCLVVFGSRLLFPKAKAPAAENQAIATPAPANTQAAERLAA